MTHALFIEDIKAILPHRYPFLLVDRVIDIADDGKSGVGIKNVTANEEFFNGHFPSKPVMPGVLIIEAMAQTAILVGSANRPDADRGGIVFLAGVDAVRFKKQVVPGDQLKIVVKNISERAFFQKWEAEAFVDGELCASATLSAIKER